MAIVTTDTLCGYSRILDIFPARGRYTPKILESDLYPPLPICGSTDTWPITVPSPIVIWGWEIINQAATGGLASLQTRRVDCGPAEALSIALCLQAADGSYTYEDLARIYCFVVDCGLQAMEPEIRTLVADTRYDHGALAGYLGLPVPLRRLTAAGRLNMKTARLLARLDPAILEYIESAQADLTFSQLRLFAEYFLEIFLRDRLDKKGAIRVLQAAFDSEQALRYLAALRFPELESMHRRLTRLKNQVLTGSGIRLEPPPKFEGGNYTLTFNFGSKAELERRIRSVQDLLSHTDELFALLF